MTDFSILEGMTLASIAAVEDGAEARFVTTEGRTFVMRHHQDCCECVTIADVIGDLADLISSPITLAEESSKRAGEGEVSESGTWTFYRLATAKGHVDIRWLGTSNGWYSEHVDFEEVTN